jgi:hypothetical protein
MDPANTPNAPRDRSRKQETIIAAVVAFMLVLAAAAAGAVVLTGVVKFGKPRVLGLSMASEIDRNARPLEKTQVFDEDDPRVYCCARVRAFDDSIVESRWYLGGLQVGGYGVRFGSLDSSSGGRIVPAGGWVSFYLKRPRGGWSAGEYTVKVYIDGVGPTEEKFRIGEADGKSESATYRDPDGRFQVDVPAGWTAGEIDPESGELAGFLGEGEDYPPRFVVLETDFDTVDPTALNALLPESTGKFNGYSLGERPGARRDYQWDYLSDGETLKLHSIQVLAQASDGTVYGLNCHSLADEYEENLPVFNEIANSFRLP